MPFVSGSHVLLMARFNFVEHLQHFEISPWQEIWKVSMSRIILLDTNYWQCNRAANWPNWQELFNNEHQIPDSLFSDRLAQTHREGHAHTSILKHTHTHTCQRYTQYESFGECARLHFTGNQIKLAVLHPPGCCCWQAVAGCPCVFFYPSNNAFLVLFAHECYPWSCISPMIMRAGSWLCAAIVSLFSASLCAGNRKYLISISGNLPHAVKHSGCVPLHKLPQPTPCFLVEM